MPVLPVSLARALLNLLKERRNSSPYFKSPNHQRKAYISTFHSSLSRWQYKHQFQDILGPFHLHTLFFPEKDILILVCTFKYSLILSYASWSFPAFSDAFWCFLMICDTFWYFLILPNTSKYIQMLVVYILFDTLKYIKILSETF